MNILREMRPRGVVHCFSGSAETAREVLKLGMYIGFTGVLTFKNAKKALKALAEVRRTSWCWRRTARIWHRNRIVESATILLNIRYVAEKIAELKGITYEEVVEQTEKNAREMYRL